MLGRASHFTRLKPLDVPGKRLDRNWPRSRFRIKPRMRRVAEDGLHGVCVVSALSNFWSRLKGIAVVIPKTVPVVYHLADHLLS